MEILNFTNRYFQRGDPRTFLQVHKQLVTFARNTLGATPTQAMEFAGYLDGANIASLENTMNRNHHRLHHDPSRGSISSGTLRQIARLVVDDLAMGSGRTPDHVLFLFSANYQAALGIQDAKGKKLTANQAAELAREAARHPGSEFRFAISTLSDFRDGDSPVLLTIGEMHQYLTSVASMNKPQALEFIKLHGDAWNMSENLSMDPQERWKFVQNVMSRGNPEQFLSWYRQALRACDELGIIVPTYRAAFASRAVDSRDNAHFIQRLTVLKELYRSANSVFASTNTRPVLSSILWAFDGVDSLAPRQQPVVPSPSPEVRMAVLRDSIESSRTSGIPSLCHRALDTISGGIIGLAPAVLVAGGMAAWIKINDEEAKQYEMTFPPALSEYYKKARSKFSLTRKQATDMVGLMKREPNPELLWQRYALLHRIAAQRIQLERDESHDFALENSAHDLRPNIFRQRLERIVRYAEKAARHPELRFPDPASIPNRVRDLMNSIAAPNFDQIVPPN